MSSLTPNRKLPSCSRLCLTSNSSNQDSIDPVETFSKYFTKSKAQTVTESLNVESPYLNSCGSNIEKLYTSLDDEKDFRSPINVTKRSNENARVASKRGRKCNVPKDKIKTTQMVLTTSFSKKCDVNPDHLQLAVALSKSLEETSGNSQKTIKNNNEKALSLKEMLAQFGFRPHKIKKETFKVPEKKKKRRFQYVTPVLLVRTEEDRQQIISEKVAEILSKEKTAPLPRSVEEFTPSSTKIKKLWNPACKVYSTNTKLTTLTKTDFYVPSLNFTPSKAACGYLLRNWSEIPGRECSPQPMVNPKDEYKDTTTDKRMNIKKDKIVSVEDTVPHIMSPELFASDDEQTPEKSKVVITISSDEDCSESLLSPKKKLTPKKLNMTPLKAREENVLNTSKSSELSGFDVLENENGICTYESFTCEITDDEACDLSRSSHEDEKHVNQAGDQAKMCNRNSTSLNVTNYVLTLLDNKESSSNNMDEKEVLDLSQSLSSLDSPKVDDIPDEVKEANTSQSSQESVCINDEELNYSSIHAKDATPFKYDDQCKMNFSLNNFDVHHLNQNNSFNRDALSDSRVLDNESVADPAPSTSKVSTPKNEVIVKTTDITPAQNYSDMDTPKIVKELEKYGLKPLKRRRGIQFLKHIYDSTHPVVDSEEQQDENAKCYVIKKRKISDEINIQNISIEVQENVEIIGDLLCKNETVEDLFFEKKQSKRVNSCRVPLHIAWHNLVSSQPQLKKNILLYEPIQLEILYTMLKDQGYNYHIQDLLTFLDRKCITIRTNQSNRL